VELDCAANIEVTAAQTTPPPQKKKTGNSTPWQLKKSVPSNIYSDDDDDVDVDIHIYTTQM